MRVLVVTPPVASPLSLEDTKVQLEVQASDWDAFIQGKIDAAVGHLDAPNGWLGRSLAKQELELRGDLFSGSIDLPFPPVSAVTGLRYLDTDGVEQLLDPAVYEVRGSQIVLAWQRSWPSYRKTGEGVRVRFTVGYDVIPAPIRAALLLMVGDMFRFRETATVDGKSMPVPMSTTVENLLTPLRLY